MSEATVSTPSLIAACYYLVVALLCALARASAGQIQPPMKSAGFWSLACAGMLGLSAMRFFALENALRTEMRLAMASMELLEMRSAFQAPFVVLIGLLGTALIWFVLRSARSRRANKLEVATIAGKLALIGLFVLLSIRIVSLHAVDTVLFTRLLGPLRLNWILDIGLATLLAAAAIRFVSASRNMR